MTQAAPVLFVLPPFSGMGDGLTAAETIHTNMLHQTYHLCQNGIDPTFPHKWSRKNVAYVDLWGMHTPAEIMTTAGLIVKGGARVVGDDGLWSAATAYIAGDIVCSPNAGCAGGSGAHNWYVAKDSHTNKEPGVAAGWATHWDKLDFRPSSAFASAQVAEVLEQVQNPSDRADRRLRRSRRAVRLERV